MKACLFRYTYSTNPVEVRRIYEENVRIELDTSDELITRATLVIEAESEEESLQIRKSITDIRHWVLVKFEKL